MVDSVVGAIEGIAPGALFEDRKAAMAGALHRSWGRGIDYDGATGLSVAIVLNDGYEDDEDYGDYVVYTGEGGQDESRRRQVRDQDWTGGNGGLRKAHLEGAPVRVLRGPKGEREHSPATGYRYDGLYSVTDVSYPRGRSGFRVCRFVLERAETKVISGDASGRGAAPRTSVTTSRIIRDSAAARWVKNRYDHECQICGITLSTPGGPYAEAAHIIPLGRPHDGPDVTSNILSLCPNDHVLLDNGAVEIDDALNVRSTIDRSLISRLRLRPQHEISLESLRHHREHIASQARSHE